MHANQKLYKFAVIYNVDNPERKKNVHQRNLKQTYSCMLAW